MKQTQEQALRLLVGDELAEDVLARTEEIESRALEEGLVFKDAGEEDAPDATKAEGDDETKAEGDEETKAEGDDETKAEGDDETKAEGDDETKAEGDEETKAEGDEETKDEDDEETDDEDEDDEEKAAQLVAQLLALVKEIEDPALRGRFEKFLAEVQESSGSEEATKPCPDDEDYPQPSKGADDANAFQLLGMGIKALHLALEDLSSKVDQLSEKGAEETTEGGSEEKGAEGEITAEQVHKELDELRTLVEKKSAPVRKSIVPTDEGEDQDGGETKQKAIVLSELSTPDLQSHIRSGLAQLSGRGA